MATRLSNIVDSNGKPLEHRNGHVREDLVRALAANSPVHKVKASYDAARDTEEFRRHWANSDSLDADSANSRTVRHKLMRRSRYEWGSNGYYDGSLETHANMVVGVGPKLRMLTQNKPFNQLIERDFAAWALAVRLR